MWFRNEWLMEKREREREIERHRVNLRSSPSKLFVGNICPIEEEKKEKKKNHMRCGSNEAEEKEQERRKWSTCVFGDKMRGGRIARGSHRSVWEVIVGENIFNQTRGKEISYPTSRPRRIESLCNVVCARVEIIVVGRFVDACAPEDDAGMISMLHNHFLQWSHRDSLPSNKKHT